MVHYCKLWVWYSWSILQFVLVFADRLYLYRKFGSKLIWIHKNTLDDTNVCTTVAFLEVCSTSLSGNTCLLAFPSTRRKSAFRLVESTGQGQNTNWIIWEGITSSKCKSMRRVHTNLLVIGDFARKLQLLIPAKRLMRTKEKERIWKSITAIFAEQRTS